MTDQKPAPSAFTPGILAVCFGVGVCVCFFGGVGGVGRWAGWVSVFGEGWGIDIGPTLYIYTHNSFI